MCICVYLCRHILRACILVYRHLASTYKNYVVLQPWSTIVCMDVCPPPLFHGHSGGFPALRRCQATRNGLPKKSWFSQASSKYSTKSWLNHDTWGAISISGKSAWYPGWTNQWFSEAMKLIDLDGFLGQWVDSTLQTNAKLGVSISLKMASESSESSRS